MILSKIAVFAAFAAFVLTLLIPTNRVHALESAGIYLGTCGGTADGCYQVFKTQCDAMGGQVYVTGSGSSMEGYCKVN